MTERGEIPGRTESETVDLFFKALLRLGVWAGDWETWYGTRPLESWVVEHRYRVPAVPSSPTDRPAG